MGSSKCTVPLSHALGQTEEKSFMGLILGIIMGASLLASALVAVWMVGAIYYDLCGGAKWGRWVALAWAAGVIAMLLVWRPLWQPIVALFGAEPLFLAGGTG